MQVVGYFKGVMGTGEHGRQLLAALRSQGIRADVITLHPEGSPEDEELSPASDADAGRDVFSDFNLLCANADMTPIVADQLGGEFFAGRYTIGFWAWEVSTIPSRFAPAFTYLDELWVGSRHVRDAIAPAAPIPVLAIPQPVSLPSDAGSASPPAGLPPGFRFLFAFDYLSVFERKNPLATIQAFKSAFAPGEGAVLIVKCLNAEHNLEAHERVQSAAGQHADVHLIERRLSPSEHTGLMNAADCYASLHRAEGFGYTLAEAMWLGKPVIATAYSGNVDFMTRDNSYLVDYQLVPIGLGNDPYPADGEWAEPDIEHAAGMMRQVFQNPEQATARGARAASEIRKSHGPESAGRAMRDRLEQLATLQPRASADLSAQPLTERARELILSGAVPPRRSRFGRPQRAARRALLRLLKPLTVHQGLVDGELATALEALEARTRALERELETQRQASDNGDDAQMTSHRRRRS